MKKLLSILLLLTACEDLTSLEGAIDQPCIGISNKYKVVSGDLSSYQVGSCRVGKTIRVKDEIICDGFQGPVPETCNKKDDNCNDRVDDWEDLTYLPDSSLNTCKDTEFGVCKNSIQACEYGKMICVPPEEYKELDDTCDLVNNNCDVWERNSEDYQIGFYYTGDPATISWGECKPGFKTCEDGVETIYPEHLPEFEIPGDCIDNDCDSLVDETGETNNTEFALLIDISGSMDSVIDSVKEAICDWTVGLAGSKIALITIADTHNDIPFLYLLSDLVTPAEACSILTDYERTPWVGYLEFQLDAISLAIDELSWTDLEHKIVLFSDEPLHITGYQDSPPPDDVINPEIDSVIESCNTYPYYSVSAFISPIAYYEERYQRLTAGCAGFIEYLDNNPHYMRDKLDYWFTGAGECNE